MTKYRNSSPGDLELPELALGGPIVEGQEFDSDEALVSVHLDRQEGGEWVSTVEHAEQEAARLAEQSDVEKPKRARSARKGGRSS